MTKLAKASIVFLISFPVFLAKFYKAFIGGLLKRSEYLYASSMIVMLVAGLAFWPLVIATSVSTVFAFLGYGSLVVLHSVVAHIRRPHLKEFHEEIINEQIRMAEEFSNKVRAVM